MRSYPGRSLDTWDISIEQEVLSLQYLDVFARGIYILLTNQEIESSRQSDCSTFLACDILYINLIKQFARRTIFEIDAILAAASVHVVIVSSLSHENTCFQPISARGDAWIEKVHVRYKTISLAVFKKYMFHY